MSRKSPAGKTGPPRFEAGPQGSSAFLLQEPCRFFKTLRSAAFGEKNRGTAPVFPRKTETAPCFHAEAARRCAKKNAAARVSPNPRHRSPHGTKKFRPARKEVPSAQLRCAEGRSLRPFGGIAGRLAFPVPRRDFRGTLVARRRLSPHRRTASPLFAGFRPAGISLVSTRAAFLFRGHGPRRNCRAPAAPLPDLSPGLPFSPA